MKLTAAGAAVIIALVAIAIVAGGRINAGIETSVKHKSAKHAAATVTSVTEIASAPSPEQSNRDRFFKVCFTIDSFDQIEDDARQRYQSAELQRLTSDGPRCKVTSRAALAKTLGKGDKLSVAYLLENSYQIDMVAISAHGEEL
jgi:hypothetical protein